MGNLASCVRKMGRLIDQDDVAAITAAANEYAADGISEQDAAAKAVQDQVAVAEQDFYEILEAAGGASPRVRDANSGAFDPDSDSILESVEADDMASRLPKAGPHLAADDVRRADRRESADLTLIENAKQDVQDQLDDWRKSAKGRPKNPESIARRINAGRSAVFDSVMSRARAVESRSPDSTALPELFNNVITAPGESRLVVETMHEETESRFATFTNRVRNILDSEGMPRLTERQNDQLRGALLETETNVPAPISRAAERIRTLMDNAREDLLAAGVEVGEVEDVGYLTRLYDTPRILSDEDGFLKSAGKQYQDVQFPMEVGKPGDVMRGDGTLAKFLGHAKRAATIDPAVAKGVAEIRDLTKAYRTSADPMAQANGIEAAVARIYSRVAQSFGEVSSTAWLHRIKTPTVGEIFNGVGPSGAPLTKERVLSGEADTIMAEYMNTDVLDILDTYARTTAQKITAAKRFGPKGERVQALIDRASREGVPKQDLDEAVELMESALGNYNPINPRIKTGLDALQAWTYLGLLTRVTFSSMSEAVTFAVRTGDLRHAVAPLVQVYRAALKTETGKDLNAMALAIGLNGNKAMEEIMQNQLGGDYAMTPKWSKLVHRFMHGVGLTALTRAQRAYGVGAATGYLRWVSQNVMAGKRTTEMAVYLNELGIADHATFAKWMVSQGTLPDPLELYDSTGRPTPRGQDYMVAVRRFVNATIQNPTAAHRPAWMNNPAGRVAGAITGFSYAAYQNVLKRELVLARTLTREAGKGAAGRRAAGFLGGAMALVIGQTVVSTIREMLFNFSRFEDKEDEEIAKEMVALGLTRSFGLGAGDSMLQYLTGLKYSRSVGETVLGASVGTAAKRVDAVASLFTSRNSPNTETTEYRAVEAVWSGAVVPIVNSVLSRIPYFSAVAIPAFSDARLRRKVAGMWFEEPERKSGLDNDYDKAMKDMNDVSDDVKDRIGALPKQQWADELRKLRAEFPTVLEGVTLDVYVDNTQNQNKGRAGVPKTTDDGGPVLKTAKTSKDGAGSMMGEMKGYREWDTYRKEYRNTKGIDDRITALNKAIKNVRGGEDLTRGQLVDYTKSLDAKLPKATALAESVGGLRPGATLEGDAKRLAGTRLVREVLEELQKARRMEKRAALHLTKKAEKGEKIERGEGRAHLDASGDE